MTTAMTPLEPRERHRLMLAKNVARTRYEKPISTVLIDYLEAWSEFGYRIAGTSTAHRLIDYLLN